MGMQWCKWLHNAEGRLGVVVGIIWADNSWWVQKGRPIHWLHWDRLQRAKIRCGLQKEFCDTLPTSVTKVSLFCTKLLAGGNYTIAPWRQASVELLSQKGKRMCMAPDCSNFQNAHTVCFYCIFLCPPPLFFSFSVNEENAASALFFFSFQTMHLLCEYFQDENCWHCNQFQQILQSLDYLLLGVSYTQVTNSNQIVTRKIIWFDFQITTIQFFN